MTPEQRVAFVTWGLDEARLFAFRDRVMNLVAGHKSAPIAIEKAIIEVRRFMTADLHAKYQHIFNEIYSERAAHTLFPDDHGTFHPYYTTTYMHLCGLIGSLLYGFRIRSGIPWMYFRKGNPTIIPNVRGITDDKVSRVFYSTEITQLYQVASPGVRWTNIPRGIGRRYILAKSLYVTQDPVRPFLIITNTSHQMEWIKILFTVNEWSTQNGDVFVVGAGQPIVAPKVVIVNCHDYWMLGPQICSGHFPVSLTIIDSSAVTDDVWFQPALSDSMMGQIYTSPILVFHSQIKQPCLKMFDNGPISRLIYMSLIQHCTDPPMVEFMTQVYSIDEYNAYPNFPFAVENELKAWIPAHKEKRIVQSSVAFRTTSPYVSASYSHRMIGSLRWVSPIQVSKSAKRLAQALCHVAPTKPPPLSVYIKKGNGGKAYTTTEHKWAKYKSCDDMFLFPIMSHKFDDAASQRCSERKINDWECSVCYCKYNDCPNPWDALVTQCCTTEICTTCYFASAVRTNQCVVCGPESRHTMPFIPAVCVYTGADASVIPEVPKLEFKPFEPTARTFMGIDYPHVFYECLRKYVETHQDVFVLLTPPPFPQRINHSNLAPYAVDFVEKAFREHNGTPRIIIWDPSTTPVCQLPINLPFITDIVIGNYDDHKGHVQDLLRICNRDVVSLRYIVWDTKH